MYFYPYHKLYVMQTPTIKLYSQGYAIKMSGVLSLWEVMENNLIQKSGIQMYMNIQMAFIDPNILIRP